MAPKTFTNLNKGRNIKALENKRLAALVTTTG